MYDCLVDAYGPERLFRNIERATSLTSWSSSHFNGELRTALALVEREFKYAIVAVMRDGAVALGHLATGISGGIGIRGS